MLTEGRPEPLGLTLDESGANIAVAAARAASVSLCLFDAEGERERVRIRLPGRTGSVFHGHLTGVEAGARYGLRAEGAYDPRTGDRYDPAKLLIDPYATALDRTLRLDPAMMTFGAETAEVMPKAIAAPAPAPFPDDRPGIPWADSVIYELHVRGFTRTHPAVPEAIRGTFAALGHPAVIAHLSGLGVTAVEVMPSAAWIDERHLGPIGLTDYWGYNPVALMAPDPRLAPGGFAEIRAAVAALHAVGIEMFVDVVLNHTGEGDERGPTLSLRGLDNRGYYRLSPEDRARYVNDSACGNTLALDRPAPLRLAMDALRLWALQTGLDGFRFDLATVLGRRDDGFDAAAPLLQAIGQDPLLRELKLIAEPWDAGPGGHQLGRFPAPWGEWNDRFRDAVRGFWRGDAGQTAELATRLSGSADVFGARGRPSRSINAVTTHDGMTLADLVAHAKKHNEANGEENRDGSVDDRSWNHGEEGATDDPAIRKARMDDQRSLLLTLFAARGTPMLAMGSELGHSQAGNNNAYAQDNALAWLDWDHRDSALIEFTRRAIAQRAAHPALREDRFLTGDARRDGEPVDVAWLNADGTRMETADWHNVENRTLFAVLSGADGPAVDRVAVILHAGASAVEIRLPDPRPGFCWRFELASADPERAGEELEQVQVLPRSALLVAEVPGGKSVRRRDVPRAILDELVRQVGIASEWHDLAGGLHSVGLETKRALLAAVGLPGGMRSEAEDSLARLEARTRRGLPAAKVVREGRAISLPLARSGACGGAPVAITVRLEEGGEEHLLGEGGEVVLPLLPVGRHLVVREDQPAFPCLLTVAPRHCYVPPALAGGARRFGISAHLATLGRAGDQGIGDFTTLAELAESAGGIGAAAVGINPLHALFPADRERASPYYPSDRRFLDPIYLDVSALPPFGDWPAVRVLLDETSGEIAALSAAALVDYARVWTLKRAVFEAAFAAFEALDPDATPRRAFSEFVAAKGEALGQFAAFQAIAEWRSEPWPRWPAEYSHPSASGVARFARAEVLRIRFHQF
ncbi:MAG: glycogen debranching protein GlgX, partial [Acetobacteraceae bacterium]